MSGVNKVILIGNLGHDPSYKSFNNGEGVTNISIATSDEWKDKNTGERQSRVEWHNVVFFGKLADIAKQFLKKGSKVYVSGSIKSEKYNGKDGIERTAYKIVANELQFLDSKSEENKTTNQTKSYSNLANKNKNEFDFIDDDIPF